MKMLQLVSVLVDGLAVLNSLCLSLVLFAIASPSVMIDRSGLVWFSVYGTLTFASILMVKFMPIRIFSFSYGVYFTWAISHAWSNNSSVDPKGFNSKDLVGLCLLILLFFIQCLLRSWGRTEANSGR